jgi:predicted membrane protein
MNFQSTVIPNTEDYLYSNTSFSGVKRRVISKDFKGGKISNSFGSTELDLTGAELSGTAVLDINLSFGEITIVVPCDWRVDTDLSQFMAVVEDYRASKYQYQTSDKVLVLKGVSCCGSIEVHHNC